MMVTGESTAVCLCVADHRPPVLMFESHHILPLSMGGPDVNTNRVWVCPTTHYGIHELLRLILRAGRPLSYHELQAIEDRPVSHYAAEVANDGYRRFIEGTATP